MIVTGIVAVLACGGCLLIELTMEGRITKLAFILAILTAIGIWLWVYDVSSPIKTTESIVQTSDLERYGLKVEAPKGTIFSVRVIKNDPTRFGAMWKESTKYKLILDEENK